MDAKSPEAGVGSPAASAADGDYYFKVYEEHAKALRTWLVAYGIGGPVFLLTNEVASARIAQTGHARILAEAFLVAVALQVGLAALNKIIMWALYCGEVDPPFQTRRRYKVAAWLSEQFWIDLVVDVVSIVLFAWATYRALGILTGAA